MHCSILVPHVIFYLVTRGLTCPPCERNMRRAGQESQENRYYTSVLAE